MRRPSFNLKSSKRPYLILLILLAVLVIWLTEDKKESGKSENPIDKVLNSNHSITEPNVLELTNEDIVVAYLKQHHKLPDYYITKNEARKMGWHSSKGDLCDVLPGKAIGGDYFGNFEKRLPQKSGRKYYEADINYSCGHRNAQRLIYSNDGLIYTTKDHYKTFQKH